MIAARGCFNMYYVTVCTHTFTLFGWIFLVFLSFSWAAGPTGLPCLALRCSCRQQAHARDSLRLGPVISSPQAGSPRTRAATLRPVALS